MNKKSPVSPSYFKQLAKKIKKEKSLKHTQALDETAKQLGLANYKNYLNLLKANNPKPATEDQMLALWSDKQNEMTKKLLVVKPLFENFEIPFQELLISLRQFQNSKDSIQSICEKSALKEYLELYFLNDSLLDEEGELDDYAPYHIAKSVSLKNLIYKFEIDTIYVEGEYDLILEFGFDFDKDVKHPTFEDEEMFGSFELKIDKNKKITTEDKDIGHYL